ncbi:MAG TPA: 2-phospho-L-lactate guanylyltransferase [Euzebya sp.]|nr:2-phospho-L-lactate guanylyltransferase [Euzebya sp.]
MAPPPLIAVVPLKAIPHAKTRMAPELTADDRALLLHRTFERVVQALAESTAVTDAVVVVGDEQGRTWATALGLATLAEPVGAGGLNAALRSADAHLGSQATLVLPADLPLVHGADLDQAAAAVTSPRCVVVAPTADGGTGALIRVPGAVIQPHFGGGSAEAHVTAAKQAGVAWHLVHIAGLALDLDRPDDIDRAGGWSVITGGRTLAN